MSGYRTLARSAIVSGCRLGEGCESTNDDQDGLPGTAVPQLTRLKLSLPRQPLWRRRRVSPCFAPSSLADCCADRPSPVGSQIRRTPSPSQLRRRIRRTSYVSCLTLTRYLALFSLLFLGRKSCSGLTTPLSSYPTALLAARKAPGPPPPQVNNYNRSVGPARFRRLVLG